MNRKAISGIVLTLLLIGMLTLTFEIQPANAEPTTWTVDDDGPADFHTIQEAINAASPGETIYVYNGIYYENVVVNKSLSLLGENRNNTIIDGGWIGRVVHVTSGCVNISGFTIRNGGPPGGPPCSGIHLNSINNCKISGNTISNAYFGIWPDLSSNNSIFNNTLSFCSYAIGGVEMRGNNQNIFNNLILDNAFGIYLLYSSNSVVSNNTILNSGCLGIYLQSCSGTTLINNNMASKIFGFRVYGTSLSHFIHDIDTSNTVNGKPIYYLINQRKLIIDPVTFPDIGFLGLVNSTNILIRNLNLTRRAQGLLLAQTTHSTVMHVNASLNKQGILVYNSTDNTIFSNTMMSNGNGITLEFGCNSITISNNTISNCNGSAISISWSHGNTVISNTLPENDYGITLNSCMDNTIYHNNFIKNRDQALSPFWINTWDNSYPSGGNYWSNYKGIDLYNGPYQNETGSDGIGDTPYNIDDNNQDHYPLMNPWTPILGDLNFDGVVDGEDLSMVTLAYGSYGPDFEYPGSSPSDRWNPSADLNNDNVIDGEDLILIAKNFGK